MLHARKISVTKVMKFIGRPTRSQQTLACNHAPKSDTHMYTAVGGRSVGMAMRLE